MYFIEYSHPCTVHAMVYASYKHTEDATESSLDFVTEFSLDLVSPVEYLFRKFSANEFGELYPYSNKMNVLNYRSEIKLYIKSLCACVPLKLG